jgi:hypothetical protein
MENIIHPNREEAIKAAKEFTEKLWELQEKYGVRMESDDSCSMEFIITEYLNERGAVEKYYHC